jgi:soluble lytic murein transglycosylase-like protein
MNNAAKAVLVIGAGYVVYQILSTPSVSGTFSEQLQNWWDNVTNSIIPGSWATSGNGPTYVPYINGVENSLGIPQNLLARIAYEESHFRSDIVSGAVKSSAGAVGLMQLMPQYFPNAGLNWQNDVQTAGNLLKSLYTQFGDWQLAVAAYNDGSGNVSAFLNGSKDLPAETQQYVADVVADVPVPGSLIDTGTTLSGPVRYA